MTENQFSNDGVASLRAQMRSNVRFRFEVLAAISTVARANDVNLGAEALGNLVFVDASEIEKSLRGPDLPGGTNC